MSSETTITPEAVRDDPSPLAKAYAQFPFTLVSGHGTRVRDTNGREYWDLYGGHAVTLLGHSHPAISAALQRQAETLLFYSNAVPLAIRQQAARRLCDFASANLAAVFFCNSGAEANENALKLAIKLTGRSQIAALRGGFHGRTLLALSATDNPKLREPFAQLLCPTVHLQPNDLASIAAIDEGTAAVIVEPVQSMAGVTTLQAEFLQALRMRCDQVGALLVYDEVQTGMGRLGRPFAAGEHGIEPDMVTSAKGLANGVPIGAVLMSASINQQVQLGDLGSTFGGGPLASAALLATLDTIIEEDLVNAAAKFGEYAKQILTCGPVQKVRGRGCLLGLEVRPDARSVQAALLKRGFITGTSGNANVLRLLPPLNTPLSALNELANALRNLEAA